MAVKSKKIFISYKRDDKQFVEKLADDLIKNHFEVWVDKQVIDQGDHFDQRIIEGIESSDFFITVLSPKAIASDYVIGELKFAFNLQKERNIKNFIIPVLIQSCKIPIQLLSIENADFVTDYPSGLATLLRALCPQPLESQDLGHKSQEHTISAIRMMAQEKIYEKQAQISESRPDCFGNPIGNLTKLGPSLNDTHAFIQKYEKGIIVFHIDGPFTGQAFGVYGGIGYQYKKLVDSQQWKKLGFPVTDELNAAASPISQLSGRYNNFENGEIVWRQISESQYYENIVPDPYRHVYDSWGGSGSFLGFPISEPCKIKGGERIDFEGGALFRSNLTHEVHYVRQLLRVDYVDSPFKHGWQQYSGPDDSICANVHMDNRVGWNKNCVELNIPWDGRAIMFPKDRYADDEIKERFCCVSFKSISPDEAIRFFIHTKTNALIPQYLEFNSHGKQAGPAHWEENGIEYWMTTMPVQCRNSELHSIIVDLKKSIEEFFKKSYKGLKGFYFRGNIGIAELMVSDDLEALKAVAINPIVM